MSSSKQRNSRQRGAALVATLCVLLTVGMLAASAIALSKASAEGLALSSGRVESWYAAESCSSRLQWMLMRELELSPDRELGKRPATPGVLPDGEHLYADGSSRKLESYGFVAECKISDMACGMDAISASSSVLSLLKSATPFQGQQIQDDVDNFANRIDDYVDSDDFVRKDSFERSDYDSFELHGLPRNGAIRFRDELAWIPGYASLFPEPEQGALDFFRPLPPNGLPRATGKPSFMCASPLLVEKLCKLNAQELDASLRARAQWQNSGVELGDSLEATLLQKLKDGLRFLESGFYTFEIRACSPGNPPGTIRLSLKVDRQIQGNGIAYYEWLQF